MSNKQRINDMKIERKALSRSLVRVRQKGYYEMGQAEEFLLGEIARELKGAALEERSRQHKGGSK